MIKIFDYNNVNGNVTLNTPEILLIREFAALMDKKRNKCKQDPKGELHLRAFREFTYIYLAIDWQSPYRDYESQDKHKEALKDGNITEEEWNDPIFRAACRKYRDLQESTRSIKLLHAAQDVVDKFIDYFHNVDPEERDEQTGKPIFKVKDIMAELTNLNKVNDELKNLEKQVKSDIAEQSSLRGQAIDGFTPKGF